MAFRASPSGPGPRTRGLCRRSRARPARAASGWSEVREGLGRGVVGTAEGRQVGDQARLGRAGDEHPRIEVRSNRLLPRPAARGGPQPTELDGDPGGEEPSRCRQRRSGYVAVARRGWLETAACRLFPPQEARPTAATASATAIRARARAGSRCSARDRWREDACYADRGGAAGLVGRPERDNAGFLGGRSRSPCRRCSSGR